ncbi:MAG: SDR family oxidoreductase [Nitrospinae bacterium]|nr:SDR family oxidoreductase [Nitrospinota bacterium]
MTLKLANKVAFITGGNSGIGLASAQEFAAQGARVVILARSREKADKALAQISGNASAVVGDVCDLKSLKTVIDGIRETHGRIDVLMTSAGIVPASVLGETGESTFDDIFNVNVKGTFFAVQYAMPLLVEGASVILVCSCVHEMGSQGYALYNSTKAAVRSLARSITPDLAPMGVRVNVLSPGPIYTPVLENSGLSTESIEAVRETFSGRLAAGRVGQPEEMAKLALFLASDDSSYMYGSDVQADGGMNQVRW